jgi:hypothetical protein
MLFYAHLLYLQNTGSEISNPLSIDLNPGSKYVYLTSRYILSQLTDYIWLGCDRLPIPWQFSLSQRLRNEMVFCTQQSIALNFN